MYLRLGSIRQFSPVSDTPFLLLSCADSCEAISATAGRSQQALVHWIEPQAESEPDEQAESAPTGL